MLQHLTGSLPVSFFSSGTRAIDWRVSWYKVPGDSSLKGPWAAEYDVVACQWQLPKLHPPSLPLFPSP